MDNCRQIGISLLIVGCLSLNYDYFLTVGLLSVKWDDSPYTWMIVFKLG